MKYKIGDKIVESDSNVAGRSVLIYEILGFVPCGELYVVTHYWSNTPKYQSVPSLVRATTLESWTLLETCDKCHKLL